MLVPGPAWAMEWDPVSDKDNAAAGPVYLKPGFHLQRGMKWIWWPMPLILELVRWRKCDQEFKAICSIVSLGTVWVT